MAELYNSLQTGVVDGAEQPLAGYFNNKFYEVAPFYTLDGHTYSPSIIVVSETTWNKLSDEQKGILLEAIDEVEVYIGELAQKNGQKCNRRISKSLSHCLKI